jgi:hypothetical protein
MQIFNLSPDAPQINNINVTEDIRTPLAPITGSPITLAAAATPASVQVLPANPARAIATILNTGTKTAYLREGTTAATTTNFGYPLLPNRLLEIGSTFRYLGAIQGICLPNETTTLVVNESTIVSQ